MENIQINSKLVKKGDIFIAISSENLEHNIKEALLNGASVIIADEQDREKLKNMPKNVLYCENIRLFCSVTAKLKYPKSPKICVAVTGTNGKSSVVHFLSQIWNSLGVNSSSLGTNGLFINGKKVPENEIVVPNLTTPDSVSLHKILSFLSDKGIENLAFEASSHALDQYRLHGVNLECAGFTNISSDHLDYHKTEEEYLKSKLRLFSEILPKNKPAVINGDSSNIVKNIKKTGNKNIITFGRKSNNDIYADNVVEFSDKITFDLVYKNERYADITANLFGEFQLMNLLCAIGLSISSGFDIKDILQQIKNITPLEGRMEHVCKYNKADVFVDYAHTSKGFESALETFRKVCKGRLITIFGCGGNRDKSKRSEMGEISGKLSDISIITDDNPRNEDPESIRLEIMQNCKNSTAIASRSEAIKYGLGILHENDFLVIIGKGHESYQLYKDYTLNHNDKECVLSVVNSSV